MATKLMKVGNSFNVPQKSYICNTIEERDELKAYFGDLALVIEDGITYILNSEGDWYVYPTGGGGGDVASEAIAPVYDPVETAYQQNQLIMYDGKLWRAKQAILAPAGDFDETKWEQVDVASAKADLISGKVPASQLPSYVDDVIEGYYYNSKFYEDQAHTTEITAEAGKIYVDLSTNESYRWSGTIFVLIGTPNIPKEIFRVIPNTTTAGEIDIATGERKLCVIFQGDNESYDYFFTGVIYPTPSTGYARFNALKGDKGIAEWRCYYADDSWSWSTYDWTDLTGTPIRAQNNPPTDTNVLWLDTSVEGE